MKQSRYVATLFIMCLFLTYQANGADPTNGEIINGIPLPPDPGAAGKKTLPGIDSDLDGVRDDIQRFLAKEVGKEPVLYKRALQRARDAQQYLHVPATNDRAKAKLVADRARISRGCFWYARDALDTERGSETENYMKNINFDKQFSALLANTPDRMEAYMKYNEMLGGNVFSSPDKLICE